MTKQTTNPVDLDEYEEAKQEAALYDIDYLPEPPAEIDISDLAYLWEVKHI